MPRSLFPADSTHRPLPPAPHRGGHGWSASATSYALPRCGHAPLPDRGRRGTSSPGGCSYASVAPDGRPSTLVADHPNGTHPRVSRRVCPRRPSVARTGGHGFVGRTADLHGRCMRRQQQRVDARLDGRSVRRGRLGQCGRRHSHQWCGRLSGLCRCTDRLGIGRGCRGRDSWLRR
jgi:hypothetical protein